MKIIRYEHFHLFLYAYCDLSHHNTILSSQRLLCFLMIRVFFFYHMHKPFVVSFSRRERDCWYNHTQLVMCPYVWYIFDCSATEFAANNFEFESFHRRIDWFFCSRFERRRLFLGGVFFSGVTFRLDRCLFEVVGELGHKGFSSLCSHLTFTTGISLFTHSDVAPDTDTLWLSMANTLLKTSAPLAPRIRSETICSSFLLSDSSLVNLFFISLFLFSSWHILCCNDLLFLVKSSMHFICVRNDFFTCRIDFTARETSLVTPT